MTGKKEIKEICKNQNLSIEELEATKFEMIKACQEEYFGKDIQKLKAKECLPKSSRSKPLYPFIDHHGVLRIGGRLQNLVFGYSKKHPIIIPYECQMAKAIIHDAHLRTMHGGNQSTLVQIRNEFWILSAKRAVKTYINGCVTCHRFRSDNSSQLMGSLPAARTKTMQKPFAYTGTDLCGPFRYNAMRARGVVTNKGYVVIFICLTTRAIHIELVCDMSAEAFVAAFRRLMGRRGHVRHLYCDNGGNFTKGNTILNFESEQAMEKYNIKIAQEVGAMQTKFHFNPAYSPWMGGIWERGVGSIKYHLKRTMGDRILSYEELTTVLVQIEAILNSRPIAPLSENPEDLDVLTPGHFLVGEALTASIESDYLNLKADHLTRWELCGRMKQEFWAKWSNDYISSLQTRKKWTENQRNFKVGDMVLIKEENTAPLFWPLGRIERIYRGNDENVRVAEIYTKGKVYKRPIGKLALLPIADNINNKNEDLTSNWYEEKNLGKKNEIESAPGEPIETNSNANSATGQTNDKNSELTVHKEKTMKKTANGSDSKSKQKTMASNCNGLDDKTNNEHQAIRRSERIRKKNDIVGFFAAAILCSLMGTTSTKTYEIDHFNNNSHVCFKECGSGALITGEWQLVSHTDLQEYDTNFLTLRNNVDYLESHCHQNETKLCRTT